MTTSKTRVKKITEEPVKKGGERRVRHDEVRRYLLDTAKLSAVLESTRKQKRHTWLLVAHRTGVAPTTLQSLNRMKSDAQKRKTLDADVLICILKYINRPLDDFILDNHAKGVNDGYSE